MGQSRVRDYDRDARRHSRRNRPGVNAGDAVLIRTGQERYSLTDPEFYTQPGMSRASTLHLTNQGRRSLVQMPCMVPIAYWTTA